MTEGTRPDEVSPSALDREGAGQSAGVPAAGQLEGNSYNPSGSAARQHWQTSFVTRPGLDERGNVFFAAIEMTRMPMVVTDPRQPDNPIVFVNRSFLDLTGYTERQLLGRNCRMLQGPQTDPAVRAELRNALVEQRAVAVDILNYKADGSEFWNALFIGPVFDADGRLLYWFSSQMDITQRRISEQSLLQAQKMEAVGQLTAGMAHDFNNLLQVIAGNLELATRMAGDNGKLVEVIAKAGQAVKKGAKLTQQLLAFARKQRLDPRRVNLNTLIVEFSDLLVRTLGGKVDLRLDVQPGLPACVLDPVHLEMALLNILINARDAMPDGGRVTVSTAVLSDRDRVKASGLPPGSYVQLCVKDEGQGMAPQVLNQAVEPFFTTKGFGTGLGLAMVHGFVQQSQGQLLITSEPGQGTTVTLLFPLALDVPAAAAAAGDRDDLPGRAASTVLLVEDNEDVRHIAEQYLRELGYRPLVARSGEEALRLLEQGATIDLLFSDVMMPGGINGIELAERVREQHPDLPVLLTTGYIHEMSGQASSNSMRILDKPYRIGELAEALDVALSGRAPAATRFRHGG
ncbi:PAS domain-containing protein [Ramlibacter sp. AW1]|uniref:histidine kinase n=1 Tax=Ramlibacter aurantiacus TaxID=2801330 RepID=A0A936ZK07_9BURK|nr:ATP-binding protein [Ramlibacter aurantiacus]MBL0419146.1 PAS domain-containing protein [Ramlibacter aurantiacus]